MDSYHDQVRDAVEFAKCNHVQLLPQVETAMEEAGRILDFERAERLRRRRDAAAAFAKPSFRNVRSLEDFRFLAVLPGEHSDYARVVMIRGGWIEPLFDISRTATNEMLHEAIDGIARHADRAPVIWSEAALQNIGLVCWHLLRPKPKGQVMRERFMSLPEELNASALRRAMRHVAGESSGLPEDDPLGDSAIDGPPSSTHGAV
jgi:hypothetical protein